MRKRPHPLRGLEKRPADLTLPIPSLRRHIQQFGDAMHARPADPGFFSAANQAAAEKMGVKRVSIPPTGNPAISAKNDKRSGGLRNCKSGAPVAKVASASSNAGTACNDPDTKGLRNEAMGCAEEEPAIHRELLRRTV